MEWVAFHNELAIWRCPVVCTHNGVSGGSSWASIELCLWCGICKCINIAWADSHGAVGIPVSAVPADTPVGTTNDGRPRVRAESWLDGGVRLFSSHRRCGRIGWGQKFCIYKEEFVNKHYSEETLQNNLNILRVYKVLQHISTSHLVHAHTCTKC